MSACRSVRVLLPILALCLAQNNPVYALVSWSNSSGSAGFFDWSGGGSDVGLFGSPTLVGGNTLVFFPSGFRAESAGGGTTTVSDRLEVTLIAHNGYRFTDIQISEEGDYGLLGPSQVEVSGLLTVQDQLQARAKQDPILATPSSPISTTTFQFGSWTGQAGVDFANDTPDWTTIKLTLSNELVAVSQPGSSAFIENKVVGSVVALSIIPEPAALLLLAAGALSLLHPRRHR